MTKDCMAIEHPEFTSFGKIARWQREVVITEKLDGTNGLIYIDDDNKMHVGSRSRWLDATKKGDNFGFYKWCEDNAEELLRLGPGHHYGEWWGHGIQRGYDLKEKRFSLFNTHRWGNEEVRPACCHVVPVLYQGLLLDGVLTATMANLGAKGSAAAPGFANPEGIIVYHTHANTMFKMTFENDEAGKGQ
jgi:hypothetical protein